MEDIQWRAVLADKVYEDITLVEMFVIDVYDKKKISALLRELGGLYPLTEFGHLKRVKSTGDDIKILVSPKSFQTTDALTKELQSSIDFSGLGTISIAQVCKDKPITRSQYEAAIKHWPTNFHENKRLEKTIKCELFLAKELIQIKGFMTAAWTIISDAKTHSKECPIEGAVVVDPQLGTIVAKGVTDPSHPLKHAVMVAIDNVAICQGGGAWNQGRASILQTDISTEESAQKDSKVIYHLKEKCEDIEEPAAKRPKKSNQYLCTGYDLYVTKEPCVMCSMALVHSRISRVFYCQSSKSDGGLGSKFKIHVQEGLNHHFEVYQVDY